MINLELSISLWLTIDQGVIYAYSVIVIQYALGVLLVIAIIGVFLSFLGVSQGF